jgi:type III restriction enzyme
MELKSYQEKVIKVEKEYLEALAISKKKYEDAFKLDVELAKDFNFPKKAWEKVSKKEYNSRTDGLGNPLPNYYLKVPTSGGKTLLACHSIGLINEKYLKRQNGLILWIVPSNQIYKQTYNHLKDRNDYYRQVIDVISGGRTLIKEKTDKFSKQDVEENLVILMLMLPSANRQNKETLKIFQDSSGFTDFFPNEDDFKGHKDLKEKFPNLDCFSGENEIFGTLVKSSLGNTLRTLRPVIIIDEGHKAYSDQARKTIQNFNPSILLELSATPPENSNNLVNITGKELDREEMIKLDIHIINKTSLDWKNTLNASWDFRNKLEEKAKTYKQNTNINIRPINLIQVERTGKEQRDGKMIHAEDAKEYLIKKCGVPEEEIAIKSSEKDDIEGIDLLSEDAKIRYIITKHALQEGWDCSFAYILTILTNPSSQLSITQLVGRILRQPFAKKTKVKELDESYVFCFRQNAVELVSNIKSGLESEGLGDIAGRVLLDSDSTRDLSMLKEIETKYRSKFKKFEGRIYLPKFLILENGKLRDIHFEMDILRRINWEKVELDKLKELALQDKKDFEREFVYGLSKDTDAVLEEHAKMVREGTQKVDLVFLTKQIIDIISNPWIAYKIGSKCIEIIKKKYDSEMIDANFIDIVEFIKKHLENERDRLGELVFRKLIKDDELFFFLLTGKGSYALPTRIKVFSSKGLIRQNHSLLEKSLLDYIPEEEFNTLEKSVALCLDEQEKLLFWYRNISRRNYFIQGWKKHKIFPDFITAKENKRKKNNLGDVFVLETKGLHLMNEDTNYKKRVFNICNEIIRKKPFEDLKFEFDENNFVFQVIQEQEWRSEINKIFE